MKPRMRDVEGVSPVVATILMVAITVVLAATAWLMMSGMMGGLQDKPPYMSFANKGIESGKWRIDVAAVESSNPLDRYKLTLLMNDTVIEASRMDPIAPGTVGNVTFVDADNDGVFGAGDYFLVDVLPEMRYEIKIHWKPSGGDQAGNYEWL